MLFVCLMGIEGSKSLWSIDCWLTQYLVKYDDDRNLNARDFIRICV